VLDVGVARPHQETSDWSKWNRTTVKTPLHLALRFFHNAWHHVTLWASYVMIMCHINYYRLYSKWDGFSIIPPLVRRLGSLLSRKSAQSLTRRTSLRTQMTSAWRELPPKGGKQSRWGRYRKGQLDEAEVISSYSDSACWNPTNREALPQQQLAE
jgi:hypothetical protein